MPLRMTYGEYFNGELILPALWQGLWTSFVQLGIMLGALINGVFQDKFGRKMSFIAGGVVSVLGKMEVLAPVPNMSHI